MPKQDSPFGPTGDYPRGKLRPDDDGGLQIGIAYDEVGKVVILNFGTPVEWIGMPPELAIEFAKQIMMKAGAKTIEVKL